MGRGRAALLLEIALAIGLGGCLSADLVPCADGRACPVGTACDEVHHGCVDPGQLTACDGLAQFDDCVAVPAGRCFDGVCLPRGCANGLVEPEELCDDGNAQSGDGCSADCLSQERCGDGFADLARGEECDDGDALNRDGCSAGCGIEDIVWALRGSTPAARHGASMTWDSGRNVLVVFGGVRTVSGEELYLADTWEWNGTSWAQLFPLDTPPPRENAAMAYDPERGRVVMFGGAGLTGLLNDTWEWNGAAWQRVRVEGEQPIARRNHAMAWDPGTHSIVMFGGDFVLGQLGDTWRWTGSAWVLVTFASDVMARFDHSLVTDPRRGKVVLVGGTYSTDGALETNTDCWTFEGDRWKRLVADWPGTFEARAAFDPARGVIVVRGRQAIRPTTWELDGLTWQQVTPTQEPAPLHDYAVAYDGAIGRVVSFGGATQFAGGVFTTDTSEVWEWSGRTWTERTPSRNPSPRLSHATAYDPDRGVTIVFGGLPAANLDPLGDLWEWNGRTWTEHLESGPGPRSIVGAAFDEVLREIVIVGGLSQSQNIVHNDVWSWNGSRWLQRTTDGPPHRIGASFAYDTVRDRLVMFGGVDAATNAVLAETWEWDGAMWTQVVTATSPPPRVLTAMAYDPRRARVVLFGGSTTSDASTPLGDTWEYDGATWLDRTSATVVEPRAAHVMSFDRARGRVVMAGGALPDFSHWEWDGSNWTQPPTGVEPVALLGAGMVYDAARRELVVTQGFVFSVTTASVWTGSYRGGVDETCTSGRDIDGDGGAGCSDADCGGICERCGDGACDPIEIEQACPADCVSTPQCGDGYCTPGETCAGDCS